MSLIVSKDGKQLGPYSLDEVRSLVLAGKLEADDWAWPNGGTDWMQLKDVPGFVAVKPAPGAPPAAAVSPVAGEEELWRGHPSQVLNLHIYLFWGIILVVTAIAGFALADNAFWALIVIGFVAVIAAGQCGWAFLHLRAIEYVITSQRVRIISGLFSKDVLEIELFRVKDSAARQSFLLRMFGLGTITILSGDEGHPRLVLEGVPRALEMRERLRQDVMTLRQKLGVREMDVM